MTRREFWEKEVNGAVEAPFAKYAYGDSQTHLFYSDGVFKCSHRSYNGSLIHFEFKSKEEVLAFVAPQKNKGRVQYELQKTVLEA